MKARGAGHDTRPLGQRLERAAFIAVKDAWQGVQRKRAKETLFIAGMQRSGTNMLMEVLERSLATQVIHERDPRAFDNYLMRSPEVIADLRKRSRAPVFVIKALCELQRLQALMQQFAPARTVWVVRHYEDVINSMLVSFPNHGRHFPAMVRGERNDWRSEGMSNETLATLRNLYHPEMDAANTAALMWYLRNILYFELDFENRPNVLAVAYEDLVTGPQAAFERIFDFLDLTLHPWHTRWVVPNSVRRRQAPELEPGVRELCDGLMTRFQPSLEHPPRSSAAREAMNQAPSVNPSES